MLKKDSALIIKTLTRVNLHKTDISATLEIDNGRSVIAVFQTG